MSSEVQAPDEGAPRVPEEAGGGPGAGTGERQSRFTLPSAYTILFALIVITAILTWIIPAGQYDLDTEGAPIPGTYHEIDAHPQRIIVDSLKAPINGMYGIEDPPRARSTSSTRARCSGP